MMPIWRGFDSMEPMRSKCSRAVTLPITYKLLIKNAEIYLHRFTNCQVSIDTKLLLFLVFLDLLPTITIRVPDLTFTAAL